MSFVDVLYDQLRAHPGKGLVVEVHGTVMRPITGRDLATRVGQARGALRERGIQPGDRVILLAGNSASWAAADLAILGEGAVCVPMYARQDPEELVAMIDDCEAKLVLAGTTDLAEGLAQAGSEVPSLVFAALFEGEAVHEPPHAFTDDDLVTLIYTSGTSGEPKGVMLTAGNVDFMLPVTARELQAMMGRREGDDKVFHYLPFCFAGSRVVLWTCLYRGNPIRISTDLDNLVQELATARPHYFLNVPALLDRVRRGVEDKLAERPAPIRWLYRRGLAAADRAGRGEAGLRDRAVLTLAERLIFAKIKEQIGPDLECLICGSAPLSEDTQRWFHHLGIPVYQVYGLTETTAIVTMDEPGAQVPGRVGTVLDGVETKLGELDELLVRGPNVFAGYWNRPEATEGAFTDGWFHTGDKVEVADDGTLRIVGRVKHLLVPSSGHNVAPEPIEQRLVEGIEGVEQAMVVGHGKPWLGAILTGDLTEQDLNGQLDAVNEGLPHYRRVRKVHLTAERFTPENGLLTANQKLKRQEVERHFAEDIARLYA